MGRFDRLNLQVASGETDGRIEWNLKVEFMTEKDGEQKNIKREFIWLLVTKLVTNRLMNLSPYYMGRRRCEPLSRLWRRCSLNSNLRCVALPTHNNPIFSKENHPYKIFFTALSQDATEPIHHALLR